jgi:hypothetical protein
LSGTRIKTRANHLRNRLAHLVELGKLPPNVSLPVIMEHISNLDAIERGLHCLCSNEDEVDVQVARVPEGERMVTGARSIVSSQALQCAEEMS